MKKLSKVLISLLFLLSSYYAYSQQEVAMADTLRSDGKIYVVVAIILVALMGLFAYLIRLDGKIGKLEKQIDKKSKTS